MVMTVKTLCKRIIGILITFHILPLLFIMLLDLTILQAYMVGWIANFVIIILLIVIKFVMRWCFDIK